MNGGELAEILARSNHDGGEGSSRKDGYGNTNVRGSRGVLSFWASKSATSESDDFE